MNKRKRELQMSVASTGATILSQDVNGSGNFKFKIAYGDQVKTFTTPQGSSSWHSLENFRKDIERWILSLNPKENC